MDNVQNQIPNMNQGASQGIPTHINTDDGQNVPLIRRDTKDEYIAEHGQQYGVGIAQDRTTEQLLVSFRGRPIPQIKKEQIYEIKRTPIDQVIEKIKQMKAQSPDNKVDLKFEAIHYEGGSIDSLKLNTGDIISVEDAIGLVNAGILGNYTTGTTRYGGQTLRSFPDGDGNNSLYDLPEF